MASSEPNLEIIYTARATADLKEIAAYQEGAEDAAHAKAVISAVRARVRTLARNGLRYRVRTEFGEGRRILLAHPYRVFYRVIDGQVMVQRILHGSRKIKPGMLGD